MSKQDVAFVTNRQFDSYARRIENRNMKLYGSSLTASGIARRANHLIAEIQSDRSGMLLRPGWREAMRADDRPAKERANLMMRKAHRGHFFAGWDYVDLLKYNSSKPKRPCKRHSPTKPPWRRPGSAYAKLRPASTS